MRNAVRIVVFLVVLGVAWHLYSQVRAAGSSQDADAQHVVVLFGSVILFGAVVVVMAEFWLLPIIGERIGNFFFHSSEQVVRDPHADALAAVAVGDYVAAIEEYKECFRKNPDDTLALSEMVRLQCERLQDYEMAAAALEEALSREWAADDAAFLASRLADVYWTYLHDAPRARHVLNQIMEAAPETRHAANAAHRLREIEQAMPPELPDGPGEADPVTPAPPDDATGQPARGPEKRLRESREQDGKGQPLHGKGEGTGVGPGGGESA